MDKNKKGKKRKNIILKILIFFILLFLIINLIPVLVVYNLPFFVKKFFNRDLTFSKIVYLPHLLYLEIENLSLKHNNLELLSIEKFIIDFDYIKLLQFNPTISYIKVVKPVTFFKKYGNNYSLPEYFAIKGKKETKNEFDFPVVIEHIEISGGMINLLENNKFKVIAKDVTIILPGIRKSKNMELNPLISGRLFDKEFKINGKVEVLHNSLINNFSIDIKDFNLSEIGPFIPDISGIKIISGNLNTNSNLIFKTYKNKKPDLIINGVVGISSLTLYDLNSKKNFVDKVTLTSIINVYDVFNNFLELKNLHIRNGNINLILDEKNPSVFLKKEKSSGKKIFKFNVKHFTSHNTSFNFIDNINKDILNFNIQTLDIKNFNTFQDDSFSFETEFSLKNIGENIVCKGNFNIKKVELNLENLKIKNLYIERISYFKKIFTNLKSSNIRDFNGNFFYIDKNFEISGQGVINNFYLDIEGYKNSSGAESIKFYLNKFNTKERVISFKYLEVENGLFPVDKKDAIVKNINFKLKENKINFIEKINEKKDKIIEINENINIDNIKADYSSKDKNFNVILENLNTQIKLEINQITKKIISSGNVNLGLFIINAESRPVFKIFDSFISVYKFEMFPIIVNINSIEANSPYIVIDIKKDKKLYLLSFNEISFKKSDNDIRLNIDRIKFNNGRIEFTDYSLDEIFKIDISNIQGEIKNFPSFVYPEGDITLTGIINNRNPVNINSSLSQIGVKGSINTKDLLISQFSPYFNRYLGYKINSGILNLDLPFEIKEDSLNAEVRIKLNNFRLTKISPKKRADLSKIVTMIEDDKGNINLNVPVFGKWGNPNIDFREIFFNIFYDILDNSSKTFSSMNPANFKKDGTIDIIYFKGGSDEPTSNIDILISEEMKKRFNNKSKVFIIEGYVDRIKDSEYLKRKILLDKISIYSEKRIEEGTEDELKVLKKIYFELYNKESEDKIDNTSLKSLILSKIELKDSDFYALSYARIKRVREFLINNYNISEDRIIITEINIFDNPYIKGAGNAIAVIISATKNN